jgi:F-box domain
MDLPVRLYRSIIQRKHFKQRKDHIPVGFSDLPVDIALDICAYLPDLNRLCLALTCRSLLELLDDDKTLQFSPMFRATATFPDTADRRGRDYKLRESPRWKLLQRLEDSSWRICSGCFKLHPPSNFYKRKLEKPADKRRCLSNAGTANMPVTVGVVRLCPCIEITYGDKKRITQALGSPETQNSEYRINNSVIHITNSTGSHQCSHSYELENGNIVTIQCKLTLSCVWGEFTVENEYDISMRDTSVLSEQPVLLCPHRNLARHVWDLGGQRWDLMRRPHAPEQREIIDGVHWNYVQEPMACPWCRTVIFNAYWIQSYHMNPKAGFTRPFDHEEMLRHGL